MIKDRKGAARIFMAPRRFIIPFKRERGRERERNSGSEVWMFGLILGT